MNFNVFEYVTYIDVDISLMVQCNLCDAKFVTPKIYNIKRHYTSVHLYEFEPLRAKRQAESDNCPTTVKQPRKPVLFNGFLDSEDYLRNCVLNHTEGALSFEYWDKKSTRRHHEAYTAYFGVNVSGKS